MDEKHSCCCSALPRTWRWLLSLLGVPLIFLLMVGTKQGDIENDLTNRSIVGLNVAGMDWVRVEAAGRGRDILLRGLAASVEERDRAIRFVRNVYGVREVQSFINVADSTGSVVEPSAQSIGKDTAGAISLPPDTEPGEGQNPLENKQGVRTTVGPAMTLAEKQAVQDCQQQLNEAMYGQTIPFVTNMSDIPQESIALLESLTGIISGCQTLIANQVIIISGHTDSMGNDTYNQRLSQQRADAVRKYFIRQGIDGTLLKSVGYGASRPVASNDTAAGRAQNRRITLEISPE